MARLRSWTTVGGLTDPLFRLANACPAKRAWPRVLTEQPYALALGTHLAAVQNPGHSACVTIFEIR